MNTTRSKFHWLLTTHCEQHGIEMPVLLLEYLVDMLDQRLTTVDIMPKPNFAEGYLKLYTTQDVGQYKDYADTCLFFTSLLPAYGERRGISMDYYATLGISTYYAASDLSEDPRYTQLGNWFYSLQRILNTAIHPEVKLELFAFK